MNRQPFGAGARWRRRAVTCGITVERLIDDSDREADLGSFDGMIDQTKSLRTTGLNRETLGGWPVQDGEIDDDREEDDPAEESEASGIGDHDGLDEQAPFRDWLSWEWRNGHVPISDIERFA